MDWTPESFVKQVVEQYAYQEKRTAGFRARALVYIPHEFDGPSIADAQSRLSKLGYESEVDPLAFPNMRPDGGYLKECPVIMAVRRVVKEVV